jgi:predicted alpha/beta superfamily hydrolase
MAFSIFSSIKSKLSPVLTTETQNKSLPSGLLGGSLSGIMVLSRVLLPLLLP